MTTLDTNAAQRELIESWIGKAIDRAFDELRRQSGGFPHGQMVVEARGTGINAGMFELRARESLKFNYQPPGAERAATTRAGGASPMPERPTLDSMAAVMREQMAAEAAFDAARFDIGNVPDEEFNIVKAMTALREPGARRDAALTASVDILAAYDDAKGEPAEAGELTGEEWRLQAEALKRAGDGTGAELDHVLSTVLAKPPPGEPHMPLNQMVDGKHDMLIGPCACGAWHSLADWDVRLTGTQDAYADLERLLALYKPGGVLVSTNDLTTGRIAHMRACGRMAVLPDNTGWVLFAGDIRSDLASVTAEVERLTGLVDLANRKALQDSERLAKFEGAQPAPPATESAEGLARAFHEAYERLAPDHGYKTREASAVPWSDVPDDNKALMIATAREVLTLVAMDIAGRAMAAEDAAAEDVAGARMAHCGHLVSQVVTGDEGTSHCPACEFEGHAKALATAVDDLFGELDIEPANRMTRPGLEKLDAVRSALMAQSGTPAGDVSPEVLAEFKAGAEGAIEPLRLDPKAASMLRRLEGDHVADDEAGDEVDPDGAPGWSLVVGRIANTGEPVGGCLPAKCVKCHEPVWMHLSSAESRRDTLPLDRPRVICAECYAAEPEVFPTGPDDKPDEAGEDEDADDYVCPGTGECHGTQNWCPECGDVDKTCNDPDCDWHQPRCAECNVRIDPATAARVRHNGENIVHPACARPGEHGAEGADL